MGFWEQIAGGATAAVLTVALAAWIAARFTDRRDRARAEEERGRAGPKGPSSPSWSV